MRHPTSTTRPRGRCLVLALASAAGLAACDGPSAPEPAPAFDAAATAAEYATAARLLESVRIPALTALGAGGRTLGVEGQGALASTVAPGVRTTTGFAPLRVISTRSRGLTFIFDPEMRDWRADTMRTGAPADGVRFVLYDVDANGQPIAEREIGHADLIDEGSATDDGIALRFVVVERGITRLEYAATIPDVAASDRLKLRGTVRDEVESMSFDLDVRAVELDGLPTTAADLALRVGSTGPTLDLRVRGANEINDDAEVRLSATHPGASLDAWLSRAENDVDGWVDLDTRRLVLIRGRADAPSITRPDGSSPTGGELLFVSAVADLAAGAIDVAEELVRPLDNLILLASLL